MESGRRLFLPADRREVVVFGAWRTAWMSGYFYNDGRVREVRTMEEALDFPRSESRLLLLGPSQWDELNELKNLNVLKLSEGPRGNVLARVSSRPDP
jgi:hypothetical protein